MSTTAEPQTLTAGRELDALIAEKVMGWTSCRYCEGAEEWYGIEPHFGKTSVRPFSSSIVYAMSVAHQMEAFDPDRYPKGLSLTLCGHGNEWSASFENRVTFHGIDYAEGHSPSEAICLAALKTIEA